jgi:hypothetical protein
VLNHPFYSRTGWCAVALCLLLLSACSTHDLPEARNAFYQGNYAQAEEAIGTEKIDGKDSVLILMERGTIYQADGLYEKSSADFIQAYEILDLLQTYSVSEGAESWIINDTVYSFEGFPFERTLLHSMTALNHLAQGNWEDAGVEARRIIHSLKDEIRGEEYPDDPFSRYIAAFILEMTNDNSNARLQYQLADELLPNIHIDEKGRLNKAVDSSPLKNSTERELICFFLIGSSPSMHDIRETVSDSFSIPQIKIYTKGIALGEATILDNTYTLYTTSWDVEAPARLTKMAARIAAKEAMAVTLEQQDKALGALARIVLIGMLERPDFRRWETLPLWLGVARLPCPADLSSFDVHIQGGGHIAESRFTVQQPLVRRGNVFFSFVRDLPGFNSLKTKKEIDKVQ